MSKSNFMFLFSRCGFDEKLECEPLACEPQPMMQKMLAIRRRWKKNRGLSILLKKNNQKRPRNQLHITTTTFVVQRNRKLPTQQCFFFNPTYYQQLQQLHNPCDMNAKQINWRQFTVKLSKNKTVSRSKLLRKWKKSLAE